MLRKRSSRNFDFLVYISLISGRNFAVSADTASQRLSRCAEVELVMKLAWADLPLPNPSLSGERARTGGTGLGRFWTLVQTEGRQLNTHVDSSRGEPWSHGALPQSW